MKSLYLVTALMVAMLAGCSTIPDAGRVLIGVAQVSQTSSVRDTLVD